MNELILIGVLNITMKFLYLTLISLLLSSSIIAQRVISETNPDYNKEYYIYNIYYELLNGNIPPSINSFFSKTAHNTSLKSCTYLYFVGENVISEHCEFNKDGYFKLREITYHNDSNVLEEYDYKPDNIILLQKISIKKTDTTIINDAFYHYRTDLDIIDSEYENMAGHTFSRIIHFDTLGNRSQLVAKIVYDNYQTHYDTLFISTAKSIKSDIRSDAIFYKPLTDSGYISPQEVFYNSICDSVYTTILSLRYEITTLISCRNAIFRYSIPSNGNADKKEVSCYSWANDDGLDIMSQYSLFPGSIYKEAQRVSFFSRTNGECFNSLEIATNGTVNRLIFCSKLYDCKYY